MEEIFITNKIKKIKLKESPPKEIKFKDTNGDEDN